MPYLDAMHPVRTGSEKSFFQTPKEIKALMSLFNDGCCVLSPCEFSEGDP